MRAVRETRAYDERHRPIILIRNHHPAPASLGLKQIYWYVWRRHDKLSGRLRKSQAPR